MRCFLIISQSLSPGGTHLVVFPYATDNSQNTHTQSEAQYNPPLLSLSTSPFTGPQEEGIYAKQAQCTNMTSTFTHMFISTHACTCTSSFSQSVSQMKMCQLLQQFYSRFHCYHFMQISNLFEINAFPHQKIICFVTSPYFCHHNQAHSSTPAAMLTNYERQ